jgi:predicted phosphodiesterase
VRYGVLADIHGNLHALRAAPARLALEGVDRYICAGDLVGYGPFPNECVETVAALDPICVAGNHDLMALDRLPDDRCIPLARQSLRWTRGVLSQDARDYLGSLPLRAEADGGAVVAHGSLDDPEEYTTDAVQARAQLARVRAEDDAHVLILGHTHRARAWSDRPRARATLGGGPLSLAEGAWVLNPGGLGQSRELRVRARFVLLETDPRRASFYAVRYDVRGCRAALRGHGLSPRSHHLPPARLRALSRPVRRTARRALGRSASGRIR